MPSRTKAEPSGRDAEIEIIREAARANVERFSLRHVAAAIGMSHTGLRDFIAEVNPRTPYGAVRERLVRWATKTGIDLPSSSAASRSHARGMGHGVPRIPPRAYELIYQHCQTLERASVPEDIIDEARRLMSGETFNTLNKGMADARDEAGWVKDVQAAWAFIRDSLVAQGYDL